MPYTSCVYRGSTLLCAVLARHQRTARSWSVWDGHTQSTSVARSRLLYDMARYGVEVRLLSGLRGEQQAQAERRLLLRVCQCHEYEHHPVRVLLVFAFPRDDLLNPAWQRRIKTWCKLLRPHDVEDSPCLCVARPDIWHVR